MKDNKEQKDTLFKLTCFIPKPLHKELKQLSLDDEKSMTRIVVLALQQYLTQRKEDGKSVDDMIKDIEKFTENNRVA